MPTPSCLPLEVIEMNKEMIYNIILITGLIPATILLSFSFLGLANIISSNVLYKRDIIILTSIISGMAGYAGIITSLVIPKKAILNCLLLSFGLIGFSIFLSYEGGMRGWKWFLTIEEPEEWFLPAWPIIAALIGLIINLYRSIKNNSNTRLEKKSKSQ